jgi:tetratricopeptide (TPR) repeat protein
MGIFSLFRQRRSWRWHYDQGMACGQAGRLSEAVVHFQKAAALAPDEPNPHYQLGYTYFLMKDFARALVELERTQTLSPGFFVVETEIDLCRRMLDESLSLPALSVLHAIRRRFDDGQRGHPETLALSRQAVEMATDCPLSHFYLGKVLLESDRTASTTALRRCLELRPDNTTAIDARLHLGVNLEVAGRHDEALEMWRSILHDFPGHPQLAMVKLFMTSRGLSPSAKEGG